MLHLLTEEHKKKVLNEYRKRVVVVLCVCVLGAIFVSAIFVIPAYFISYGRYSEVTNIKKTLEKEISLNESESTAQSIKDISDSIQALGMFDGKGSVLFLIKRVVSEKPNGIRINHISYLPGEAGTTAIDLAGVADTRQNLVNFSERLKKDKAFTSINVPLSNFAKDKNIDFSMKILVSADARDVPMQPAAVMPSEPILASSTERVRTTSTATSTKAAATSSAVRTNSTTTNEQ